MGETSGNNCGSSQFFMQNAPAHIYIADPATEGGAPAGGNPRGSALQKPEESRLHLERILRQALKKQAGRRSNAAQWRVFLAGYIGKNARANDSAK